MKVYRSVESIFYQVMLDEYGKILLWLILILHAFMKNTVPQIVFFLVLHKLFVDDRRRRVVYEKSTSFYIFVLTSTHQRSIHYK